MFRPGTIGQAACGLAFFLGCAAAYGGSFSVNPVRGTLSPDQRVTALTVRNNGTEATVVQISPTSWSQQDGVDAHSPTNEILATPPIFTLQPGATQTVRIGLRRAPDPRRELTYRLLLREVPATTQDGFQGLRMALQISIPIFVNPPVPVAARLQWQATLRDSGEIELRASNNGNAHIQIADLELARATGGAPLIRHTAAQYLLVDTTRTWMLNPASRLSAGTTLSIRATTDSGDLHAQVVLQDD